MLTKYKVYILVGLWLFSLLLSYGVGSITAHKAALRGFVQQFKSSEIEVGYGRYIEYRDMSTYIEQHKYEAAKCVADLGASSHFEQLETCLADTQCSKLLDKEHKIAPELFDKKPTGFNYYPIKNGIRSCKE